MAANDSLVRRVAWGAALAASAAALLSAFATIALASYMVGRAEDRRLSEAAATFAGELEKGGLDPARIRAVHRDESEEMAHTGMAFAVYDRAGRLSAGDGRLVLPRSRACATTRDGTLRVCPQPARQGLTAVAGAAHASLLPVLTGAALVAALLAALLAWLASRPISRYAVSPLTRLRERIAAIDVNVMLSRDLGPSEGVLEVDALRRTIDQLIERVEAALSLAQRFAANAAHELRTPLTSLRAELELFAEAAEQTAMRSDVLRAQEKLTDLCALVDALLVLSVPAHGASAAHDLVSLRDLLEDAVAALPPADRARVHVSDADATVRGDATLLATMVTNALSNGLKFGRAVTTRVEVRAQVARLSVEDDGAGIDEAEREQLFEPFFRGAAAQRRRTAGHGLGLPLIRHIARTHGGDAVFTSAAPARLEITLPAVAAR